MIVWVVSSELLIDMFDVGRFRFTSDMVSSQSPVDVVEIVTFRANVERVTSSFGEVLRGFELVSGQFRLDLVETLVVSSKFRVSLEQICSGVAVSS